MEVIVQALAACEGFWWLSPARLPGYALFLRYHTGRASNHLTQCWRPKPSPPHIFKVLLTGAVLDGQADAQEAGNEIPSILGILDAELPVAWNRKCGDPWVMCPSPLSCDQPLEDHQNRDPGSLGPGAFRAGRRAVAAAKCHRRACAVRVVARADQKYEWFLL